MKFPTVVATILNQLRTASLCALLYGSPQLLSAQDGGKLAELEKNFNKTLQTRAEAPFQAGVQQLNQKFTSALQSKKAEAAAKNDLKAALSLDGEIQRLAQRQPLPDSDDPGLDKQVVNLRQIYRNALAKLEANRRTVTAELYSQWSGALEQYQVELTKAVRLQEAEAVLTKRKEIQAVIAELTAAQSATPEGGKSGPPPPPGDSMGKGNLVIKGKLNGKPFQVPQQLADESFAWIKSIDNGAYVGTRDLKVYFVDQNGAKENKINQVQDFIPDSPWLGTVLSREGSLHWKYGGNKEKGTVRNVTKFFYGGHFGTGSYHSLLALTSEGELELITFDIRLKWNFHSWAHDKRFSDITMCAWKGIGGGAMAMTTDGSLFAFNAEGFYKLPPEISSGARSLAASRGAEMRYSVVMQNGDVYGWSRGLQQKEFPLNDLLMVWEKTQAERFGGKKPVKIHQRWNWKTVMFEDGTWEAWDGVNGFRQKLMESEIGDEKYSDLQMERHQQFDTEYVIGIR